MKSYTSEHSFYCLQCGNKGIPLMRQVAKKREPFHRKKLYCFHCKTEINHIECKNDWEIMEFKENFMKGVYADEAQASISYVRSGGLG